MRPGLLLVDKPVGVTSFNALRDIRRNLQTRKTGHAGTLDLFASGLLIVAVGEATKALSHLILADKTYLTEVIFGVDSATLDPESAITFEPAFELPNPDAIRDAITKFQGEIMQTPPLFSALKQGGKRISDRVRAGEKVVVKPRPVIVRAAELLDYGQKQQGTFAGCPFATVRLEVGSGFYVRSFARDLGESLGTKAICGSLRRESVGPYSVRDAIDPDQATRDSVRELTPKDFSMLSITLSAGQAIDFFQGRRFQVPHTDVHEASVFLKGEWIGFAEIRFGFLRPKRVVKQLADDS